VSPSSRTNGRASPPSRSRHPQACLSPRSVDLAGRSVALSPDIPAIFDEPLAVHHRTIGRWAVSRDHPSNAISRVAARRYIERSFKRAVLDIFKPIELADFAVNVLHGGNVRPPAITVSCTSVGQLDLGWIEDSDAPIPWRATAYGALEETLGRALPVFSYHDLFEEIAMWYWEGETDDEAARERLIAYHGADPDDLDEMALPSTMNARRPDWMIGENAASLTDIPSGLRERLETLRQSRSALDDVALEHDAWNFETETLWEYLPDLEECAHLPPVTLAPVEQFARELDDIARQGMEVGFMDVAGLCPLTEPGLIDGWFASLKLGAQFLLAAQELIQLDPTSL
jgi:hypothetical protein